MGKVVLAYSGGLDTSVAIKWLQDKYGFDVIALAVDVGEEKDFAAIKAKALEIGAVSSQVLDLKAAFAGEFLWPALQANALYQGVYPLSAALSRPLIARALVQTAQAEGASHVAHGCTGKGNDQVRFDVSVAALAPSLKVIAPVREWPLSREEEIAYAARHGIPVPVTSANPFSIDANLWGRSIECGVLEDPWAEPPAEAYVWTKPVEDCPAAPAEVTVSFAGGIPTGVDGRSMPAVELIACLNRLAGRHGVGRIDHVEDRLVGIKSREVYECPAAVALIAAHRALEALTLPREVLSLKPVLEAKFAELIYTGLWYSPLRTAIAAFIAETQQAVAGDVRLKFHRGNCLVVGRRSPVALYRKDLATYAVGDSFAHEAAEGFIRLWGLPTAVWAQVHAARTPQPLAGE